MGGTLISSRHLNNLAAKVGSEMAADRDAHTAAYFAQALPRMPRWPNTSIALATVSIDGGRMQTRLDGVGPGFTIRIGEKRHVFKDERRFWWINEWGKQNSYRGVHGCQRELLIKIIRNHL